MTTLSNFSIGSQSAIDSSFKARRTMTGAIARLSTGERTLHGNDPAGASVGDSMRTQSRSATVAARNAENGISFLIAAVFSFNWRKSCSKNYFKPAEKMLLQQKKMLFKKLQIQN